MSQVIDPPEVQQTAPPPVVILPPTHPTSGMPKNYRVEEAMFGGFKRGSVIPKKTVVNSAGHGAVGREDEVCNEKVRRRKLSETYDEVNVDLAPVKAFELASSTPAPVSDVKDLEVKVSGLRADLETLTKDRDGWKDLVGSKDMMLTEQQGLIGELRATLAAREQVIEKQQGEIRVLTDAMDAATKPEKKK